MKKRRSPSRWFNDLLVRILVKERRTYNQRFPYDLRKLRTTLRGWCS